MWILAVVLTSLLGAVICSSPIITRNGNFSMAPLSTADRERFAGRTVTARSNNYDGFKFMYFNQAGDVVEDTKPATGHYIKVVGSPNCWTRTMTAATQTLIKLMRHTPEHIFNRVADSSGGAGVFSSLDKITVFPEFAVYADKPECKDRCDGECSVTCTADGRKVDSLSGATAGLALALEDNVLCTSADPYHHGMNALVHEFSHMVDKEGLTATEQAQNRDNLANARANDLWQEDSYAMSNSAEYFAQSTGAFFLVNLQTAGMTDCSYGQCRTESDARDHIKSRDPNQYNFLVQVWTSGNGDQASGLEICHP